MSKKKKGGVVQIKLVSTAGTGYFYTTFKKVKAASKLELKKYDPRVRKHVIFKESKMK